MSERVVSKFLFDFPMKGKAEGLVAEIDAQLEVIHKSGPPAEIRMAIESLSLKDDDESRDKLLGMIRANMVGLTMVTKAAPEYKEAEKLVTMTEFSVPTSHDGDFAVPVEVYTPQQLSGKKGNPAYIFAHGGGCVSGTANGSKPMMDSIAVACSVVVFNVDYRLAPETTAPNNVKDFCAVVEYVSEHAESLGIDPARICVAGESGGGYVCLGACVLLAQQNKSHLVKLAVFVNAMVDDYAFSDPAAMTNEERSNYSVMRQVWRMVAGDQDTQSSDPLLYPGKASDEILAKFPPSIIIEGEMDMFITSTTRLSHRLRRVGRLLEFIVFPGANHATCLWPSFRVSDMFVGTFKTALEEYLIK